MAKNNPEKKPENEVSAVEAEWLQQFLLFTADLVKIAVEFTTEINEFTEKKIPLLRESVGEGEVHLQQFKANLSKTAQKLIEVIGKIPQNVPAKEQEVLVLLRQGFSDANIAARLGKSENTVKAQVKSLFRRFGVNNRTELAAKLRVNPS